MANSYFKLSKGNHYNNYEELPLEVDLHNIIFEQNSASHTDKTLCLRLKDDDEETWNDIPTLLLLDTFEEECKKHKKGKELCEDVSQKLKLLGKEISPAQVKSRWFHLNKQFKIALDRKGNTGKTEFPYFDRMEQFFKNKYDIPNEINYLLEDDSRKLTFNIRGKRAAARSNIVYNEQEARIRKRNLQIVAKNELLQKEIRRIEERINNRLHRHTEFKDFQRKQIAFLESMIKP